MKELMIREDITVPIGNSPKFIVRFCDHAMINAFIPPGAELVIDPCVEAVNGNIVVAELYNRIFIRYIQMNAHKSKLIAANKNYPDVEINATHNLKILGVVSRILIDSLLIKGGL